jgi:hypothetical protein
MTGVFIPLDVFEIKGRGVVLTGSLQEGKLTKGMLAQVLGKIVIINGIESFKKSYEAITSTDIAANSIGILVDGISQEEAGNLIENHQTIAFEEESVTSPNIGTPSPPSPAQSQTSPELQNNNTIKTNHPIVAAVSSSTKPTTDRRNITKYAVVVVIAILLGAGGLIAYRYYISSKIKIYQPQYLPDGYNQSGPAEKGEDERGSEFYALEFSGTDGGNFSLSQQKEVDSGCIKPDENDNLTLYEDFLPQNASEGCKITLGKATASETHVYRWIVNDTKFILIQKNDGLTHNDVLKIANSLTLKTL